MSLVVSLSTILIKDGVAGTEARIDWTYASPTELEEGVVVVDAAVDFGDTGAPGICPATFVRPCVGRLNAGVGFASCSDVLFAARSTWYSLQLHIEIIMLAIRVVELEK
jgi:hypothetical protein